MDWRAAELYRASHEGQFLDTIALSFMFKPLRNAAKEAAVLLYSPATDTFREDMTRNADRLLRRGAESYEEAYFESLSKSAEESDHPIGVDMIKFS